MFFKNAMDAVFCAQQQADYYAAAYAIVIARDGFVVIDIDDVAKQGRQKEILEVVNPVGICSELIRKSAEARSRIDFEKADGERIARLKRNPLSVPI